jgi:hypothetical protein
MLYQFSAKLTREEIIDRLNKLGDTGLNQIGSPKDIVYKLSGDNLRLRKSFKLGYNSYRRFFYGTIKSNGNQTIISGEFRLHPLVKVVLTFWFGGIIVLGGSSFIIGLLSIVNRTQEMGKAIIALAAPLILYGFGIGLLKIGRKKDEEWLINYLMEKFELDQMG